MKRNVGNLDRTLRLLVGLVAIALGVYFETWWGLIGLIPLFAAVTGWCPVMAMTGTNSRKCDGASCCCKK